MTFSGCVAGGVGSSCRADVLDPDAALRHGASSVLALFQPTWFPDPLPSDVDLGSVRRFLEQRCAAAGS